MTTDPLDWKNSPARPPLVDPAEFNRCTDQSAAPGYINRTCRWRRACWMWLRDAFCRKHGGAGSRSRIDSGTSAAVPAHLLERATVEYRKIAVEDWLRKTGSYDLITCMVNLEQCPTASTCGLRATGQAGGHVFFSPSTATEVLSVRGDRRGISANFCARYARLRQVIKLPTGQFCLTAG